MANNFLVSVCIPTYNNAKYIGKTLNSIINQTYKNIEIIICDNASTDNTKEIIESFADKRIRYHRNSNTIVCLANWNLSVKLAQGDFIAIYHSDDVYESEIVEKEVEFFERHIGVGAVFCLDKTINEKDEFIKNNLQLSGEIKNKEVLNFTELFSALLGKSGGFLIAPTFMARKEIFNRVGFFEETTRFGESTGSAGDTEMWLRIATKFKIGIIKERLIQRRISNTQGSTSYESSRTIRANHFVVLDSFLNSSALDMAIERSILRQYEYNKFWDDVVIAINILKKGENQKARELLLDSFSLRRLLVGFKNIRNFVKLIIFFLVFTMTVIGFSKNAVTILKLTKKNL